MAARASPTAQLSIAANGGNGIVVQDDATTPSSRGGVGFSQFFGLNDIFKTGSPSILTTGLSSSDAGGFANGGTMDFTLKGPDGQVAKQASVTLTAGMTIGNIVTALNTAFGGAASFALDSNGALSMTPSAANAGCKLNVTNDTTARGTTGMSFTPIVRARHRARGRTCVELQRQSRDHRLTAAPAIRHSLR